MTLEVEQKFPLKGSDGTPTRAEILSRLAQLGCQWGARLEQVDRYFAHPARDFAVTDEALRLRRVGADNCITYKGPKLDASTKTRREIELPIEPGVAGLSRFASLLEALSFRPVREVAKTRTPGHLAWQGRHIELALDEVARLGLFLEIELVTDDADADNARAAVRSLAEALGLARSERRSYLEMLLEADGG
ncbi:MAG: class IV adenylate cyclase [Pirellulales bacterium]|nr:class IV adenylate cyclase [Pirellulales bacterium]